MRCSDDFQSPQTEAQKTIYLQLTHNQPNPLDQQINTQHRPKRVITSIINTLQKERKKQKNKELQVERKEQTNINQ